MSIKVAVLGIGEHARRNTLPALFECASVDLIGLFNRNQEHLRNEAERYQCKAYASGDEMLADNQVDAIYVALPTGLHAEWGQRIIQANKHLWCEKSLTHEPSLSREIIIAARQKDLSVCECFMYIHHPEFERLKKFMPGNEIGHIKSITARFSFPHLDPDNIRYNKDLGGGALLDAGCYLLHAVQQLSKSMPIKIHAVMNQENTYEVDTTGSALLTFESDLQADLEWGFGLSYVNEIELSGELGKVRATRAFSKPADFEPLIEITQDNNNVINEIIPSCNHFVKMFNHFASACTDTSGASCN